jgi:hypothetical protein
VIFFNFFKKSGFNMFSSSYMRPALILFERRIYPSSLAAFVSAPAGIDF